MGSRLKQNPERTFNWFFEATCPVARDKDPGVLFQFPEDFSNKESCQTLPKFCFPYDIQRVRDGVAVQHFTFVLTDLEGCQQYGFCRLTNSTNTCLCILSYLPWFEVFYKLLNNLADYLTKGQIKEMKALLAGLYKQSIPLEAGSVTLQMGEQILVNTEVSHPLRYPEGQEGVPYFISPDPKSLPSIPENRNLTELIVAVDVGNLLQLYASMLFERRVLIFASKLSTLTSCVHALSAVLYPMYWQHIFIPVLPPHLLDYCCAPMPYLIGVHTSLSERVRSRGLDEVVILNVDTNTLETPFDDFKRIPSDVMTGLKVCLKRQAVSPGCGVSKAFLKAQALLFGGYRDAVQGNKDGEMGFSEEMFLDHKSSSMRHFLQSAIHLQFFKQFIDGRLDILNKKMEPDDLFEEEILKCETSAGRSKSYQQLVGNIKKGGGALILNMKSRAHIKAKNLTKSGLKNLVTHKTHNQEHSLQRGGSVSHRRVQSDCLQNRLPITQHFGKSRPRRPIHKYRAQRDEEVMADTGDTWDGAASDPVVKPESELRGDVEEGDDSLLCDPEEMDLLGEIFDTLSTRSSHERGLLYGTRSLDLFGSDSHDYIMKHGFPANPSQESLSLSISGSGSLHSWNLETTEELSDVTEDSDWPCLDNGVGEQTGRVLAATEMGEQASELKEVTKHEENKATIKKDQDKEIDGINDATDLKAEGVRNEESKEKSASLGEVTGREVAERQEDEKKVKWKNEQEQSLSVAQRPETGEDKSKIMKDVTSESKGSENQENRDNREATESLNKLTKPSSHLPNTVEEQQAQNNVHYADPATDQEERKQEPVKEDEPEVKQILTSPKVLSAVAHFQSRVQHQGFPVKSRAKDPAESKRACTISQSKEKAQTHLSCQSSKSEENHCSEGQATEEPPSIKVSELKKRFEA